MRTKEEIKDEMFKINLKIIHIEQLSKISDQIDKDILMTLNELKLKLTLLRKEMIAISMSERKKQK